MAAAEYGPVQARRALEEAGTPEVWPQILDIAQAVCDEGLGGPEFLRRVSVHVHAIASVRAHAIQMIQASRARDPAPPVPEPAERPPPAGDQAELEPRAAGRLVQLSLWDVAS